MNPPDSSSVAPLAASAGGVVVSKPLLRYEPPLTWRRVAARGLRQGWATATLFLMLDVAGWLVICNLLGYLRHSDLSYLETTSPETQLLGMGIILLTLFAIGGYDRRSDMTSLSYTSEHIIAMVIATALASLLIYAVSSYSLSMHPSRGVLLASFALFTPLSMAYRRPVYRAVAVNRSKQVFVVLGAGEVARQFYQVYRQAQNPEQLRFIDVTGGGASGQPLAGEGSPVIEADPITQLDGLGADVSGVIVAAKIPDLRPDVVDRLVRMHFQRTPVYTMESFYETYWRRVPVRSIEPAWPLQMGFQLARDSPYSHLKRMFDLAAAAAAILLLSPVLIALVLLTWLDSGRPALFRQSRVGRDNRPFTIYKFRTMFNSPPPTRTEDLYTKVGDSRITRLGHWLRKLRLDELPQLFNVLKGDMSLIGPRAEWTKCAERYEQAIPCYHFRHLVKPGITGWAQVNYPYGQNEEDALQKLKYDLYYIRHYSLLLDAMIVLKTLHIMVWGKGQ